LHDDTRMLRRLLRPVGHLDPDTRQPVAPRAKVLFATVSRHGSRWYVSLNVQAPDFHAQRRHPPHPADDSGGFVGVDRGLAAFAVAATADGSEVRRSDGFRGSTPASPTSVEASSTRSPASSSRPTTGSAWKTSPSPTS
jgi:putative transposase